MTVAAGSERVLDRIQIEDLARRYAHGIDNRDWAQVDACFAADAHVTGTQYSGAYPEYIKPLRQAVERFGTTMHFFGNQLTDFVGDDGAHVVTYGIAYHLASESGTDDFVIGVRYVDDVRRADGGWQITHRTVEGVWRTAIGPDTQVLQPPR
ncbi:MAG: hypothetical protein JWO98_281 [Frankiales bacterium]|nr:hypothetical protein [Frankiales bacterium]